MKRHINVMPVIAAALNALDNGKLQLNMPRMEKAQVVGNGCFYYKRGYRCAIGSILPPDVGMGLNNVGSIGHILDHLDDRFETDNQDALEHIQYQHDCMWSLPKAESVRRYRVFLLACAKALMANESIYRIYA